MSDVAPVSLNAFSGSLEEVRPDAARVRNLMVTYEQGVYSRTNRLFAWLLPVQWLISIATALWWVPRGAAGADSVKAAILMGGLFTLPSLAAIRWLPYHPSTRFTVALSQAGFSALLILMTGGRIETPFHVFA